MAGVVYFDNPDTLSGGWCSVDGEKATRFDSVSTLNPQVMWFTNASFTSFQSHRLSCSSHIRGENFFKLSLSAIASEVDINAGESIPVVVETISGILSRVIELTTTCFPGITFGFSLSDSIYNYLNLRDQQNDPAAQYQPQFQSAYQDNSVVQCSQWSPGDEQVRLIPNRVSYAEMLLSYPVPTGSLRECNQPMQVEEFLSLDHPAIAQCEISMASAINPQLMAFDSYQSGTAVIREWASQPEIHFLHAGGAKIKIHRTIQSSGSDVMRVLPAELTSSVFARSSYSAGLLAENIVNALMSKRSMRSASKQSRTKYFFSRRAAHLNSVDRMLSFSISNQLQECGFRVTRYGFGGVTLRASAEEIPRIMSEGADFGFMLLSTSKLGKDG